MKKYTQIGYIVLVAILGFIPAYASAATVYLESSRSSVAVGDTFIVTTKINAEGVTINTVEGDVAVKNGATLVAAQEFSLANSAFGLWPRTPSLSADGQTIVFVGGVPGGFNIEGATMFKTVFLAKKVGTVTIAPQNIVAYANDGKGTKLPVQSKELVINITAKKSGTATVDEWGSLVAGDKIPPEDFIVVLGQDKTLFEGKKFAYFSALDNQSGISHYEVSENGAPAVRSGSTYVLQDQVNDVKLSVTAFDKAGNKKVANFDSKTAAETQTLAWPYILGIVLVIIVAGIAFMKWKKSKNNNVPPTV